jgi:hypothetical protein
VQSKLFNRIAFNRLTLLPLALFVPKNLCFDICLYLCGQILEMNIDFKTQFVNSYN